MERIYFKVSQWYNEPVKLSDFHPDHRVQNIGDVQGELLNQWGINTILLDVDNTLTNKGSSQIEPSAKAWIEAQINEGRRVLLCSNNFSQSASMIAQELRIESLHLALKPFVFRVKKRLRIGNYPSPMLMIGDQVFTDIWLGKRLHAKTILVNPLSKNDWLSTKFVRIVERFVLKDKP